jgi:hypothetical protein
VLELVTARSVFPNAWSDHEITGRELADFVRSCAGEPLEPDHGANRGGCVCKHSLDMSVRDRSDGFGFTGFGPSGFQTLDLVQGMAD